MTQSTDVITEDTAAPTATADPAKGDTPPVPDAGKPAGAAAPAGDILDTDALTGAETDATKDVLSDDDASGDEGVPDRYDFDLTDKLKEAGFEVDEGKFEKFSEAAKEMGLSQAQFQSIIEYQFEQTQGETAGAVEHWENRVQGWRDTARTDKDFGGENYDANVKQVAQTLQKFGDADLTALVRSPSEDNPDGLAIGNNPAFLRFVNRISKVLSDPQLVLGEDVQKSDATEAKLRRMYPSMYKD
tara:strand:- start:13014 stop:13745 length:732 start_codon:yes stop_codon:yes gene_type:complete